MKVAQIPFSVLGQLFDQLASTSKTQIKLKMIKQFISQFFGENAKHMEIYMLMRLLLPQLDR